MTGRTPFGTAVKYGCGEGRKLMRGIDEGSGAPILYDEFFTFCQWNQTYAKDPTVVSMFDLGCVRCSGARQVVIGRLHSRHLFRGNF